MSDEPQREEGYTKSLAAARVRGAVIRHITPKAKAELKAPSHTGFAVAQVWAFIGDIVGELINTVAIIIATYLGVGVGGFVVWVITSILELIIFDIPLLFFIGGSIRNNSAIL